MPQVSKMNACAPNLTALIGEHLFHFSLPYLLFLFFVLYCLFMYFIRALNFEYFLCLVNDSNESTLAYRLFSTTIAKIAPIE